jgi:hypothetical protein
MIQATTHASAYQATFSRKDCLRLATACLRADSLDAAADIIARVAKRIGNVRQWNTWGYHARRFAIALRERRAQFRIFNDSGNIKLPFCAFSALPIFTCPGAGDCKSYCYSLRAWRYPAAYFRQLQNTLFLRFTPELIESAFQRIKNGRTLRLYVDGDIANHAELQLWFRLLQSRPDVQAYGYSKSWEVFLEHERSGGAFTSNYALNISSGSIYGAEMRERMLALPITRGEFIAVQTSGHFARDTMTRFADKAYHADVRAAARVESGNPRVFSCTGRCGTCAKTEHACGDRDRFRLVTIAIGIH